MSRGGGVLRTALAPLQRPSQGDVELGVQTRRGSPANTMDTLQHRKQLDLPDGWEGRCEQW